MYRTMTITTAAALAASAAATHAGVTLEDITEEQFSTVFADTGSNAAAGEIYAPNSDENPIGQVASFGAKGRVAFIQNGPYYLVNPNAWAFSGAARADVTFTTGVESVSIAGRGTSAGDTAGPNGLFPFTSADGPFVEADAIVWALDALGNFIDGSRVELDNASLKGDAAEVEYTADALGEPIWGVAFVQNVDDPNAGLFVGGLGFTVPAPGAAGLLGVAGVAAARRRRR